MSTATKSRGPKQRTFTIEFTIDGTPYSVAPLAIDPAIGHKAFRFHKLTADDAVYDVHADTQGLQCQCLGFLRHGHCKHVQTIQAAGKLFNVLPPAARQYRSLGDVARNAPEVYGAAENPADAWLDAPASEPWTDADIDGFAAANGQAND